MTGGRADGTPIAQAGPTLDELALGAFLHDIGKLGQRALTEDRLWDWVRHNESVLLPTDPRTGRHTHRHVLFTEQFFAEVTEGPEGGRSIAGIRLERAREAAVYHHAPDGTKPWTGLVAEADRLASGMERKARDVAHEAGAAAGRRSFRTTPLLAIQSRVRLASRAAALAWYPPRPLTPRALIPSREPPPEAEMGAGYRQLWDAFLRGFGALARVSAADHLHQGLLSLSERLLWAVPSSTVDEPDVSLHDHALAVAAIAACLHRWHRARGSAGDPAGDRDREIPKFRLLEGDLSGIQATLFRLRRQQVKGVNRILRGRSFRLQALAETAALLLRRELGLPPYNVLLRAGGRFTLLVPDTEDVETRVGALQERFDRWLVDAYSGELALVLALSDPLCGADLLRERWPATWRAFAERREAAKLRALASAMAEPRIEVTYPADGTCAACGVRPRVTPAGHCHSCAAELELGRRLPRARAVFWTPDASPDALFGELAVEAGDRLPAVLLPDEPAGFGIGAGDGDGKRPTALPWRLVANHLPTWRDGEWDDRRFEAVIETDDESDRPEEGKLVTLRHLAQIDREEVNGRLVGRPMLAVLKADVDDLGRIFGPGLGGPRDRSIARTLALSRAMDAFFSGHLPDTMRRHECFRWIYTVYAGGDDLLLIGPWLTTIRFAVELRRAFAAFGGDNPDLRLSAGIELVDPDEPLNRSVRRAEERLEAAKKGPGKDRVSLIVDEPVGWDTLDRALARAKELCRKVRKRNVPLGFLHRLLRFADLEARARSGCTDDLSVAMWNARFQYLLARQFPRDPGLQDEFRALIGRPGRPPEVPPRIPLSIAIWRNR